MDTWRRGLRIRLKRFPETEAVILGWSRDRKKLFVRWDGDVLAVDPEDWEVVRRTPPEERGR